MDGDDPMLDEHRDVLLEDVEAEKMLCNYGHSYLTFRSS